MIVASPGDRGAAELEIRGARREARTRVLEVHQPEGRSAKLLKELTARVHWTVSIHSERLAGAAGSLLLFMVAVKLRRR
jgi:hypothetical protein